MPRGFDKVYLFVYLPEYIYYTTTDGMPVRRGGSTQFLIISSPRPQLAAATEMTPIQPPQIRKEFPETWFWDSISDAG